MTCCDRRFHNVTCSLGTISTRISFWNCATVHACLFTFDVDANQSGQQAAEQLALRLSARGITARRVLLPQATIPTLLRSGETRHSSSLFGGSLSHEISRVRQKISSGADSPIHVVEQSPVRASVGLIVSGREFVRRLSDKTLYSYAHSC